MIVCPYCQTGVSEQVSSGRLSCACRRLSKEDFGSGRRHDWWYELDPHGNSPVMNVEDDGSFYHSEDPDASDMGPADGSFREAFVESLVLASRAASVLES